MSVGMMLLRRMLRESRPVTQLARSGIQRGDFVKNELAVYDFIYRHLDEFGVVPQKETVEAETGVALPQVPEEPLGYWVDRVLRRTRIGLILTRAHEVEEAAGENNLELAEEKLADLWTGLYGRRETSDVLHVGDVAVAVLQSHDARQKSGRFSGIPFGLPYLDAVSDGAQAGDTVALVGRPGVGKSFLCLQFADNAHQAGEIPMVVSMEMAPEQCVRRILALRAHVPATLVRMGRLSFWGRDQIMTEISNLQGIRDDRPFYIFKGSMNSTVEDLEKWARDLRPTALYVDGAYLLRTRQKTQARWERVTYTAEYLKALAGEFSIPVIQTYQFNRRGAGKLGNIAYSDAIAQLASIVLSLTEDDRGAASAALSWSGVTTKMVELLKGREGERGRFRLLYDMNRMIIREEAVLEGMEDIRRMVDDDQGGENGGEQEAGTG